VHRGYGIHEKVTVLRRGKARCGSLQCGLAPNHLVGSSEELSQVNPVGHQGGSGT
jgi:hypothetical protein